MEDENKRNDESSTGNNPGATSPAGGKDSDAGEADTASDSTKDEKGS